MSNPSESTQAEIIRSWHERAYAYHELIRRWPVFTVMVNRLLEVIPEDFEGHALDIAAGSGLLSKLLLEKHPAARITLVEPAENMRALALQHPDNQINIVDATGDSLNTLGITVDAALCSASFHLMNEATVLPSIASVLRTGSVFAANCWGHSVDEAIELNQKADWIQYVDQVLGEFDQPLMLRPKKTESKIKSIERLRKIAADCGLHLVETRVVTVEIPSQFNIEFAAMDAKFLGHVKKNIRKPVIDRALELCQGIDTISIVDFCFEKVSI